MVELLNQWLPNVMDRPDVFIKSIQETFIMVGWSGAISFVVGLFLGVLITVTKPGNILEHPLVYQIIDKVVNLFRSVPFIILLACLVPPEPSDHGNGHRCQRCHCAFGIWMRTVFYKTD